MSTVKNEEQNILENTKNYFKGVKTEWNKITWPDRQQILVQTVAVFFVVFVFTVIVYLMDIVFKYSLDLITNR
ncbi:MAG TPA: preprotein translocase subunit SecE [Candidatus Adamsella sp.]|nr:preprotein translocase subunit SecE [Candidatus Adamsella sp.]